MTWWWGVPVPAEHRWQNTPGTTGIELPAVMMRWCHECWVGEVGPVDHPCWCCGKPMRHQKPKELPPTWAQTYN